MQGRSDSPDEHVSSVQHCWLRTCILDDADLDGFAKETLEPELATWRGRELSTRDVHKGIPEHQVGG